jgi:hypothetical protein
LGFQRLAQDTSGIDCGGGVRKAGDAFRKAGDAFRKAKKNAPASSGQGE